MPKKATPERVSIHDVNLVEDGRHQKDEKAGRLRTPTTADHGHIQMALEGVEERLEQRKEPSEPDSQRDSRKLKQPLENGHEVERSNLVEGVSKNRCGVLGARNPDEYTETKDLSNTLGHKAPSDFVRQVAESDVLRVRALRVQLGHKLALSFYRMQDKSKRNVEEMGPCDNDPSLVKLLALLIRGTSGSTIVVTFEGSSRLLGSSQFDQVGGEKMTWDEEVEE
ncbi:hypothetical protein HG531_011451 [Fusarium graminearum]|nr:hypothetical protein HG531_011451 [Fusarium graminearum]